MRVGLVGARGYVGRELLAILARHPSLELAMVTSQKDVGRPVGDAPSLARFANLSYAAPSPEEAARAGLDAWFLALPNGTSGPWVDALGEARIVDLSADHRFDDAWVYGQPERMRGKLRGARRIANPGCYATAAQLALAPVIDLLASPPSIFGVSGYSGAGTTPSPKNDPDALKDNLIPYSLVGHVHEREVSRQLGRAVYFVPHVAPFFRGITCTVTMQLTEPHTRDDLWARYTAAYAAEPLVSLSADPPLVRDAALLHGTQIGGLALSEDGRHAVVVATIDNLLGGAASQAVRNLNLALDLPENEGVFAS